MKTTLPILAISLVLCTVLAVENIVEKLGLQEQTAKDFILKDFVGRFSTSPVDDANSEEDTSDKIAAETKIFQIPSAKLLSSVVTGDKKAAAKELCAYVKAYVNSPQFKSDYQQLREATKPESEPSGMDPAQIESFKASIAEMEKQIETLKASPMTPKEAITQYETTVKQMKAQIPTGDPTPNKTKWMKTYPEDPSVMVKARLNEYLQLLATVDFTAQLTGKTVNNQKFAKAAYESQSLRWKAIYRAGKDVNDVASAFAKEWLKELK
ncbi:hypothetical protein WBG78_08125 [Chryseolinea sp. T2]|uniref:hypothetical protein n=1 Tax=Chryseolinea sp. T2 TaxID=3129255 RepID=UPI0030788E65